MNREKKQMVVLGVLALMIVCVGAFQMMGGSSAPAPAPAAKKEEKTAEKTSAVSEDKPKFANPDQSVPLAKRDPFAPSAFAIAANVDPATVPPTKPGPKESPRVKPIPDALGGPKPEFNWEAGGVKDSGVGPLVPPAPKFGYTLIGFVQGKYPAAVFADATGNQKLVEAGDAIDGSATLVAVYGNKVKVKFHDQTLVLTVGGNPNGK
ncbi:MAG: hypothetical protein WCK51_02365 [Armatimonadota bacterium]